MSSEPVDGIALISREVKGGREKGRIGHQSRRGDDHTSHEGGKNSAAETRCRPRVQGGNITDSPQGALVEKPCPSSWPVLKKRGGERSGRSDTKRIKREAPFRNPRRAREIEKRRGKEKKKKASEKKKVHGNLTSILAAPWTPKQAKKTSSLPARSGERRRGS